jgi:hypothetical protein
MANFLMDAMILEKNSSVLFRICGTKLDDFLGLWLRRREVNVEIGLIL